MTKSAVYGRLEKTSTSALKSQAMRPPIWNPPIELSAQEQMVAKRIRAAKLFLFLRKIRHQLFDREFQQELAGLFKDSTVGKCPIAPAQICLAIIVQAYTGVSDDEALEAMIMDRRWQLVLDCIDGEQAPFGKGTLVRFRAALIAKGGDRRLIERTIEIAKDAGAEIITNSSLKGALDLDWDEPSAREQALIKILQALNQVENWIAAQSEIEQPTKEIDRAYLTSHWVKERSSNLTIICKSCVNLGE